MQTPSSVLRILIISFCLSVPLASSADEKAPDDENFYRILYPQFAAVKSFGNVSVIFEGEDAKKIGLDEKQLSDFMRLRFKNNFADIAFKDRIDEFWKIYKDKNLAPTIGNVTVRVWVVGSDYPIAYHIRLTGGTFEEVGIHTNAMLGYGSKTNAPDAIRKAISDLLEQFAITFFKARGEL